MTPAERMNVPVDGIVLEGRLHVPDHPCGMVIVAHDGLTRPTIAGEDPETCALAKRGFATLVLELLSSGERGDPRNGLNTFLLARRFEAATNAIAGHRRVRFLPIGYLADGTHAAGALLASVSDSRVRAIVCRRGRTELAEGILDRVTAPTLVMVDRSSELSLARASDALDRLRCPRKLVALPASVPGLDARVRPNSACADWFGRHLGTRGSESPIEPAAPRRRVIHRSLVGEAVA